MAMIKSSFVYKHDILTTMLSTAAVWVVFGRVSLK